MLLNDAAREIRLSRGIVHRVVGEMKTEASKKPVSMEPGLAGLLDNWKAQSKYNGPDDWVFASPDSGGTQPYWPEKAYQASVRTGRNHQTGSLPHLPTHSGYSPESERRGCEDGARDTALCKQPDHDGHLRASSNASKTERPTESLTDDYAGARGSLSNSLKS